jgi:hypothetical protein
MTTRSIGPRSQLDQAALSTLVPFVQTDYEMPLSYDLVMEAYGALQLGRDYKLAFVHAATAVEGHVLHLLHAVLVVNGDSPVPLSEVSCLALHFQNLTLSSSCKVGFL